MSASATAKRRLSQSEDHPANYRGLLEVMALAIEMGSYSALEAAINERGKKIEALDADGEVAALNEMRDKLAYAKRIEAIHGNGALLNLDHHYIADRLAELPPAQVENARRYRKGHL